MKNPYTQQRLKRLKRRSKLRYVLAVIGSLPKYLVWLFSKLIPKKLGGRLIKILGNLVTPFGFARFWLFSRPWKKLLYALPLLAGLIWIESTVFLAGNRTDAEKFGDYRQKLLSSVSDGEYGRADFLAGKLLISGAFENDAVTLYAAMVAAHQNGNFLRRDLLMKRLTENLKYAPAHMWYAHVLLRSGQADQELTSRAIMHMNEALKISDKPDRIRISLAEVYKKMGRDRQAIQALETIENPATETSVELAKLYIKVGDKDKARELAASLLGKMNDTVVLNKRSVEKRIELLSLLAELRGNETDVGEQLLKLSDSIEDMISASPNDRALLFQQAEVYMTMANWYLGQSNVAERSKALVYMEKSVATGVLLPRLGNSVLSASNLRSDGKLTESQIREALALGNGVSMAHILLALDAWKKNLMEQAKFHLNLAKLHEPLAMEVMRRVSRLVAKNSKDTGFGAPGLSFEDNLSWRSVLKLLDVMTTIEAADFDDNLVTKAMILAEKQRWNSVVDLLEPHRETVDEEYRLAVLGMLYKAVSSDGNREKMKFYRGLIESQSHQEEE